MPILKKADLLQLLVTSVEACGWNVLIIENIHPFRLHIYSGDIGFRVRIYIWNITHGGGQARPANEYRIQITGLDRFENEPEGKVLILGWWDEAGVFAGFDFGKHSGALGSSPSFQIREECLVQADTNGFSPCLKENQEIAIAFRPDFLVEYIAHLESLHTFGESSQDFAALEAIANNPRAINDRDLDLVSQERRTVVTTVHRRLRSASFRSRVLKVYNYSCAFCGLQLNLIQSAHILPIVHEKSNDEIYNGIAACFLHHAAYDVGLITFDESYTVLANETQMEHLVRIQRDGKMAEFRAALRPTILLPSAVSDRPHAELVRLANQVRGWSS